MAKDGIALTKFRSLLNFLKSIRVKDLEMLQVDLEKSASTLYEDVSTQDKSLFKKILKDFLYNIFPCTT